MFFEQQVDRILNKSIECLETYELGEIPELTSGGIKEKVENINILLNTIVERFFKLFDEIMESFCQKCDIEMPVQSDGTNKISFFVDFFTTQHKNHQNTEEYLKVEANFNELMKKLKDICQNMNVELPSEAVNSATEIDSIFNELQKSLENLDVQNDQIKRLEEDLKILEETNASIIRHEAHVQLELEKFYWQMAHVQLT